MLCVVDVDILCSCHIDVKKTRLHMCKETHLKCYISFDGLFFLLCWVIDIFLKQMTFGMKLYTHIYIYISYAQW